jgi:hypothetical protein
MNKISSGLRTLFLVHFIVALIFGLADLLIPATFMGWFGMTVPDVNPYRLVGAAVLAFGASSWLGYKAAGWDDVRIIVQTEIVWTVLASVVLLYGVLFAGLAAAFWINAIIMIVFAIAFIYFYSKK